MENQLQEPLPQSTADLSEATTHIVGLSELDDVQTMEVRSTTTSTKGMYKWWMFILSLGLVLLIRFSWAWMFAIPVSNAKVFDTHKPDFRLDLNYATAAQLQALPDVGPRLASAVVSYRETHGKFDSLEELLNVRGLGETTLGKIRPMLELRSDFANAKLTRRQIGLDAEINK